MGSTMEDQLEFDFERDVQKKLPKITAEDMVISDPSQLGSFRIGR